MGRGSSLSAGLRPLWDVLFLCHWVLAWFGWHSWSIPHWAQQYLWPRSQPASSRQTGTLPFCALSILTLDPSVPLHPPKGISRTIGISPHHVQVLGNWEGTPPQGPFLPKHAPLQGKLQGGFLPEFQRGGRAPVLFAYRGSPTYLGLLSSQ